MTDEKIKHLEFIQNIITRMNTNSFQIKGWNTTIVAAFLAVYASTKNEAFLLCAIMPSIVLWFLDTYYLQQERKFRGLYKDVAGISNKNSIKPFEMRPDLYTKKVDKQYSFRNVFWSETIWKFYLPIIILIIGYLYFERGLLWLEEFFSVLTTIMCGE